MFSFRQKIFITYVVAFLVFLGLMFPFASRTVKRIVFNAMRDRAIEIIAKIQNAPNNEALIRRLKDQKHLMFFRVSIIDDQHKILYDSHIKRLIGPKFSQEQIVNHPEVLQAYEKGYGYNEDYSELLGQKFAYWAMSFDFHGKNYVIRTAFPYRYVIELSHDFEIGFLNLATVILLLFSLLSWFTIHHLTAPIQQIITAVKPYKEGEHTVLPLIKNLEQYGGTKDEIGKLANTLNSLSMKIQKTIDNLTDERNEKAAVLESLVEGVIAIDKDMRIIYANSTALKFLGFGFNDLVNRPFSVTGQGKCLNLLDICQKEDRIIHDTMVVLKQETGKFFLDVVAAPKRGKNGGAILVLQDKTSHYKLLEMRKDFIANASHELKTPITIIRGFAEALHDNPQIPKDMFYEITEKIVNNCQRMTKLIKNLLTLSDVENIPESRLNECELADIIASCVEHVKDAFNDAKISIVTQGQEEFYVIADPYLLEMAFNNLIENAAKYSKESANITITLRQEGQNVIIDIADEGIGIPEGDIDHIFQRFYTVNKHQSRKMGGAGLGLSLVETIIEKHFGKISVRSVVGKGTTFTISLPTNL